jgi:hypothetical protein
MVNYYNKVFKLIKLISHFMYFLLLDKLIFLPDVSSSKGNQTDWTLFIALQSPVAVSHIAVCREPVLKNCYWGRWVPRVLCNRRSSKFIADGIGGCARGGSCCTRSSLHYFREVHNISAIREKSSILSSIIVKSSLLGARPCLCATSPRHRLRIRALPPSSPRPWLSMVEREHE